MNIRNLEFKARVDALESYENMLLALQPHWLGLDHQVDTYFNVPSGRLKLREGNIENALIQYEREDVAGVKESRILLYRHAPDEALKKILIQQFGIRAIVDKKRKIYRIDQVKFHFDIVRGLGSFVEVEVIDEEGVFTYEAMREICDGYLALFKLEAGQMVDVSYADLILNTGTRGIDK